MSTMDPTNIAMEPDDEAATNSPVSSQDSQELYTVPKASSVPELACGVLSKTVVESPVANTILPVRMRSNSQKDLAFVGVS